MLLPRETLAIPAPAALVERAVRTNPEAPAPWFAVLEEDVFQALQRDAASAPAVCTLGQLVRAVPGAGDREPSLMLKGMTRAHVYSVTPAGPDFHAQVVPVEPSAPDAALEPLAAELRALGIQRIRQRPAGPFYLAPATVEALREPEALVDLLAAWCDPDLDTRRAILAAVELEARMRRVIQVLRPPASPDGSAP